MTILRHMNSDRLKRQLRRLAARIDAFYDGYTCGASMADIMNGEGQHLRREFRKTYEQLRAVDPNAPPLPEKFRYA